MIHIAFDDKAGPGRRGVSCAIGRWTAWGRLRLSNCSREEWKQSEDNHPLGDYVRVRGWLLKRREVLHQ